MRSSTGTRTTAQWFVGSLGHTSEDNTGLIYMRARYMDPVLGRFASEDPAKSGENWYAYCGNDPVGATDPSGCSMIGAAIANLQGAITDLGEGGSDIAIEQVAKTAIRKAVDYWSGYIAGYMLADEAECIAGSVTGVGFAVKNGDWQIGFDYLDESGAHGGPHADMQGSAKTFFRKTFGKDFTHCPLSGDFMSGFQDGFLAAL